MLLFYISFKNRYEEGFSVGSIITFNLFFLSDMDGFIIRKRLFVVSFQNEVLKLNVLNKNYVCNS